MTKKWLYFVLFLLIFVAVFVGWTFVHSEVSNDEIGVIANELNWEREAKQKCFDNLTYEESRQSLLGYTKPCVQYDERIMELKEKLD